MIKENLSLSTKGKTNLANSGVGKKFLIISISMTILLNGSVALWFFWYVKKYGIDKFIS